MCRFWCQSSCQKVQCVLFIIDCLRLRSFKKYLKVSKFQNESIKSSHCPKYERKIWKFLSWILRTEFFKFFRSYFGQCDDFIFSFWNLLTFSSRRRNLKQKQFDHVLKMHRSDIIICWSLTPRINGTPVFYAPWPKNYLTRSQSGSNKMSHIGLLSTMFIAT